MQVEAIGNVLLSTIMLEVQLLVAKLSESFKGMLFFAYLICLKQYT